jgi:hypothetical protein
VNKAFENDSGQQDIQHNSSHSNGVPIVAATTDKTKLVCVLTINYFQNNFKFFILSGRQIFSKMQYQFCVSCSIKCVMIANNELRRI